MAQAQFLNFPGIKYDVNKFIWLGLANTGPIAAVVRKDSPIQTMDQWLESQDAAYLWLYVASTLPWP